MAKRALPMNDDVGRRFVSGKLWSWLEGVKVARSTKFLENSTR